MDGGEEWEERNGVALKGAAGTRRKRRRVREWRDGVV